MQNKIFGIVLYRKVIKENNLFVKILSENDELITGIVYGGDPTSPPYTGATEVYNGETTAVNIENFTTS